MRIPELNLPYVRLAPGEDVALARAIEAGVFAQHLIEEGSDDPRLAEVVRLGEAAAERFSWVGVRMALKYALRTAYVSGLPEDELFQDGCVAVAEAIRRFDFTRSYRFTTFVHEYLFRVMCDGGRHRVGQPLVSRADRRAARQALRQMDALGVEDSSAVFKAVIAATGLSVGAASRGRMRLVALDESAHSPALVTWGPSDRHGDDFLALLLPRHRRILQLRYGFNGPVHTLKQVAEAMNASASTVARWEREALEAARHLLGGERTTAAAAYRG